MATSFGSGNWTLAFKIKSNNYYTQQGTIGFKLWRSANADGSSALEITAGWNRSSTFSFTAANQYQTGTAVWSAGSEVIMSVEYLFLEIEIQCTSAGNNNTSRVLRVHNEGSAESLTTPTYTAESWFQRIFWCG